jgi:hypothetical protein
VHRSTSEFCGFRQRRAAAQELESTTQGKDLKVVEHLGGKAVGENTVADRISEEFCEALPSGH